MKKFILALAITGTLAACNNSSNSTEEKKDSIDSVASEKIDMIDSSAEAKKDIVDSSAEVKKDALDKMDSAGKRVDTLIKK